MSSSGTGITTTSGTVRGHRHPAGARATRRKVLGRAADNNALVIPAHPGCHGTAEMVRDGSKFAIEGWAPFAPYPNQG
ncbi:hypothetical protein [Streptomyces lunaelactis]|uniref:hypothetical protein n=1 Tax=Streptomyces lunaelactis TaxID=1535768 RepID=UPI0035A07E5C